MKLLLVVLIACPVVFADWTGVSSIPAGRAVSVEKKTGGTEKGEFIRAGDESIVLKTKKGEVSVARADVARVQIPRNGHAKWWGLAIGAGAGASVGSPLGSRIANESGGDFNNLKGGIVAVVAVVGALIGLAIGGVLDARHTTVYGG